MSVIVENSLQVSDAARGGITTIGHVFAQGDVPTTKLLTASVDGADLPLQVDILSTWPDGSAKHASLSIAIPDDLAAGEYALQLGAYEAASADAEAPLNVAAAAAEHGYDFEVQIDDEVIDVAALLAAQGGDPWLSGPLASQVRVETVAENGLSLRFDVTARADGTFETSVIVGNDNIETTTLDALTYSYAIRQNGEEVLANDALVQPHFTVWRESFSSAPDAEQAHIVYDIAYLRGTGLLPSVDTNLALTDADTYSATLNHEDATFDPLELGGINNVGGIEDDRGATGTTPSYGLITDDQHSYLVTQTAEAREATLALTDQYGAFSNYYRNPETGEAYQLEDTDFNSSGTGSGKDIAGTDGIVDRDNDGLAARNRGSHDPSEYYLSFLITGDRYYSDGLAHEAGGANLLWANGSYLTERGAVDFSSQLREQSWVLRDLFYGASLAPDGSHAQGVLNERLDGALQDYLDYYVNDLPLLNQLGNPLSGVRSEARFTDGDLAGVLQSFGGTAVDRPYWQDWFGSVLGQIAATGNEKAIELGEWLAGFSAERFLQDDFDPSHNLYSITGYPNIGGSSDLPEDIDWAGLNDVALASGGAGPDVNSFEDSTFYAAAAWGGTASLFTGTGDARYAEALLWIAQALTDEYIDLHFLQGSTPQFAIPVGFSDGSIAGATDRSIGTDADDTISDDAGNRIINAGAGDDTILTGEGSHLVEGGDGNDTLIGGGGEDWLFGGSGSDVLIGGGGENYLQGDRHDEDFGRYADEFRFVTTLGTTTIGDFTVGQDRIVLSGLDLNDTALALFEDTEDGARLDLGEQGDLLLSGVAVSSLGAGDIVVVADELETASENRPIAPVTETVLTDPFGGGSTNDFIAPTEDDVRVRGRRGDDHIVLDNTGTRVGAGAGDDLIEINNGSHRIWTGGGNDAVVIADDTSQVDLRGFHLSSDVLYFKDGVGGIENYADVLASLGTYNRGVQIQTETLTVLLRGKELSDIHEGLFGFYSTEPPVTEPPESEAETEDPLPEETETEQPAPVDAPITPTGRPTELTVPQTVNTVEGSGWLNGGSENDLITSGGSNIRLSGSGGDDHLILEHWNVRAQGGDGNDLIESRDDSAILYGDAGYDTFYFNGRLDGRIEDFENDVDLIALEGTGFGYANVSQILAGLTETTDGVTLSGLDGDELLIRNVTLSDLDADDFLIVQNPLIVRETTNTVTGSGWLNGGAENDLITSGGSNIRLTGSGGDDHLILEHWNVRAHGGDGNDLLESRDDSAILYGEGGADTFYFNGRLDGQIMDFEFDVDVIALSGSFAYSDAAQVIAGLTETSDGVVLNGNDGDALLIRNVSLAQLDEDDFAIV